MGTEKLGSIPKRTPMWRAPNKQIPSSWVCYLPFPRAAQIGVNSSYISRQLQPWISQPLPQFRAGFTSWKRQNSRVPTRWEEGSVANSSYLHTCISWCKTTDVHELSLHNVLFLGTSEANCFLVSISPTQRNSQAMLGGVRGIQKAGGSRREHEGPRRFLHEDLVSTTTSHGCYFPPPPTAAAASLHICLPHDDFRPLELLDKNQAPGWRSRLAEGLCPLPTITVILGTWGIRFLASAAWRDTYPPTHRYILPLLLQPSVKRQVQVFSDPFQCLHTSTLVQVRVPSWNPPSASCDCTFGMSAAALQ